MAAFMHKKAPNIRPNPPGIFATVVVGGIVGAIFGLSFAMDPIFENIGIIKEDEKLEGKRKEIIDKCTPFKDLDKK